MMNCDYERLGLCTNGENIFRCKVCGHTRCSHYPDKTFFTHPCGDSVTVVQQAQPPRFHKRITNFTRALIFHVVNGMPTCTQQQINQRLEVCRACPLFNGEVCTHEKCGCPISNQGGFLSKLAWADQACPDGRWSALAGTNHVQNLDSAGARAQNGW